MTDAQLIEWLAAKFENSQVNLAKEIGVEAKTLSAWK
jgi:DNA-binding XRE family transcriptional regulator